MKSKDTCTRNRYEVKNMWLEAKTVSVSLGTSSEITRVVDSVLIDRRSCHRVKNVA